MGEEQKKERRVGTIFFFSTQAFQDTWIGFEFTVGVVEEQMGGKVLDLMFLFSYLKEIIVLPWTLFLHREGT